MSDILTSVAPWADWWIANLWRATWQGAIVIAVVWAVARQLSFLSPRVVCWLWRLACVKLLVALVWTSSIPLPLLPANSPAHRPAQLAEAQATTIGQGALGNLTVPAPIGGDARRSPQISPATAAKVILAGLWIAGVALALAIATRQWRAARRLVALSVLARDRSLRSVCRQQARALGVRHLPELRISRAAACPALVGTVRPAIVFPHDVLAAFDFSEISLIAGHELAHQRRHDLVWNWLLLAARALFFFHPLVWLLSRGWEAAQESACDTLVLAQGSARPSEYGRLLLALAMRPTAGQRPSFAVAGVFGTWGNLERRVLAMANFRTLSRNRLTALFVLVLCAAIVIVIPWRLVAQETKQPTDVAKTATVQVTLERPHNAAAQRLSMNNLKQLMLAMHNYAADTDKNAPGGNHRLPSAYISKDGKPLLSWRVAILPYCDSKALYNEFHLDEPWDSEHNKKLIAQIPDFYLSPASNLTDGRTVYLTARAPESAFPGGTGLRFLDITDGTSNTVAVVEVPDELAVPWTKPDDLKIDWDKLGTSVAGRYVLGNKPGFLTGFCDGSAHWLRNDLDKDMLKAIFTARGGEVIDWNKLNEKVDQDANAKKPE